MSKLEVIESLKASIPRLSDEQLFALAELARSWSQPSVFSALSTAEREQVDRAVDELDRGATIPLDQVEAGLDAMITAADA